MKPGTQMPLWTIGAPVLAVAILAAAMFGLVGGGFLVGLAALGLGGSVFAAVHHAEVVAHRVGEPLGTLVLALAVTLIEVALIVSLMTAGGEEAAGLARDTVFAAVMIILNGIIGLCLLVGGLMHREQSFSLDGASAALVALATIVILTLVFPNYTVTTPGPYYSPSQLVLIATVTLVVYGAFIFTQTVGNRPYFLVGADEQSTPPAARPGNGITALSSMLLVICLVAVVLLAKKLAPSLETAVSRMGAPDALVGVIIAGIVLLPEALAAVRAALANRLQPQSRLGIGSCQHRADHSGGQLRLALWEFPPAPRARRQIVAAPHALAVRGGAGAAHGTHHHPARRGPAHLVRRLFVYHHRSLALPQSRSFPGAAAVAPQLRAATSSMCVSRSAGSS
jgi:Ca2+:H+ antiporter